MEMDRPSVAFARFLDSVEVEGSADPDALRMVCGQCSGLICMIESGDTLRVLLNTALAHDCP